MHERRPEDGFAGDELVGAVLRAGRERAPDAERAQQQSDVLRAERVERRRVPDVRADGPGTVLGGDGAQAIGDVRHRLVPARRAPRAVGGDGRVVETIRIVVHVDGGQPLVAGEAGGHGMVAIGRQLDQRTVLDVGQQAAARLADPAERAHRDHDRSVGARRLRDER